VVAVRKPTFSGISTTPALSGQCSKVAPRFFSIAMERGHLRRSSSPTSPSSSRGSPPSTRQMPTLPPAAAFHAASGAAGSAFERRRILKFHYQVICGENALPARRLSGRTAASRAFGPSLIEWPNLRRPGVTGRPPAVLGPPPPAARPFLVLPQRLLPHVLATPSIHAMSAARPVLFRKKNCAEPVHPRPKLTRNPAPPLFRDIAKPRRPLFENASAAGEFPACDALADRGPAR